MPGVESVGTSSYALKNLGPSGQAAISDWVADGGRYVGWLDGAVLASAVGISSATFEDAESLGISSPGALVRTAVDGAARSPPAWARSRTPSGIALPGALGGPAGRGRARPARPAGCSPAGASTRASCARAASRRRCGAPSCRS
jgi:hypothetical protein